MAQPRHRVRLGAYILPTLHHLVELRSIPSATKDENLTSSIFQSAKSCHIELARLAYPGGAVDAPVGSHTPPQPDILLAG
jgi:hypothetical protein